MNNYKTNLKERVAYGSYFSGQNLLLIITLNFLMLFYTDYIGLSAGSIGVLFLIAKLWDAFNDPIMGIIVDKAKFKNKNKFKPWISIAIFLLPLASILLFSKPFNSPKAMLVWAYSTYILWGMIYTISDIPIFALATVMTKNQDERVKIISIGRLFAGIGGLIGAAVLIPLKANLGWSKAMIIISIVAFIVMIPVKYKTKERIEHEKSDNKNSLKDIILAVIKNKYLLIVYGVVILTNITNSSSTTMVYFVTYNLGNELLVPYITFAAASSVIILPIFLPYLIIKFGKRTIFSFLMILSIASSIVFYYVGYNNLIVVYIFVALKYIALNLPILMMAMFTTDCLEYGYIKTGKRYEGIVFSIQTFSVKITLALQGVIGAFTLARTDYAPNIKQSSETLNEIWRMNTIYPLGGQILAVIVFLLFYKLTEKKLMELTSGE